ncbi:MAG TPA: methyltransferase domain-containing protein [Terriglobia bacterium]|nr:methyltransferase domain-containing protein [Terriglobia bacterium]
MSNVEIIYDLVYSEAAEIILEEIGKEAFRDGAFGEYLGQTGYMTEGELRRFLQLLEVKPGSRMLEVGCGGGGCAVYVAARLRAHVTGIDLSGHGIRKAKRLAHVHGVQEGTQFERADASLPLTFEENSFDAVLSNDAMLHIARRAAVLAEWRRILKPGARMLFTDAAVLTGIISSEEISPSGQVGSGHLVPPGLNERLIQEAGFQLLAAEDLTASVEQIAKRISDGFAQHRDRAVELLGEEILKGLETHYCWKYTLAKERRLSRFMYLAQKPL